MRRGVLRAEVEDHVAGVELDAHLRVGEVTERARIDVELGQRRIGGAHEASLAIAASAAGVPARVVALTGHGLDVDEPGPRLHHPRQQRVVLAQRVALELRREVEVAERRMAVEHEAVHLPALALVPVGTRVDRNPRLHEEGLFVDVGLQRDAPVSRRRLHAREHLEATVGSGGAVGGLGRLHRRRRVAAGVVATFLRRGHPVDAGDEREEVAVERALRDLGGGAPVDAPDAHDGHAEHVGPVDHGLAQRGLEPRRPARRGWRRAREDPARPLRSAPPRLRPPVCRSRSRHSTTIGSPRQRCSSSWLPMPSFWMRSWRSTIPWISASGRGGQPGM